MIKFILTCVILCSYPHKHALARDDIFSGRVNPDPADRAAAVKSITGFLQWYKINLLKISAFPFLAKDNEGFSMIDKKACSDYLAFLRGSNFISGKYIAYWQRFFDDKAELLKTQKTKDDIPEDFDMEFILMTQKPEIMLNNISKLKFKVISINSKSAVIGVTLPSDPSIKYEFEMVSGKTGWQIVYISTANFD